MFSKYFENNINVNMIKRYYVARFFRENDNSNRIIDERIDFINYETMQLLRT